MLAPAAQAADLPLDSPWEGFYAGVHGEYLWGEPTVDALVPFADGDFDGFAGGVTGGYNHVIDQILIGIEADLALSEADGVANATTSGEGLSVDLEWLSTIRGRAGFVHENLLLFVTGGLAMGRLEADYFGFGPMSTALDETAVGYTIGAGAEWAVTENVTIKAEYLYIDLANEALDVQIAGYQGVGLETSLVRFGVNWQF